MVTKLKLHSPDFTQANIAKLAELFPNCVTEIKDEGGRRKDEQSKDELGRMKDEKVGENSSFIPQPSSLKYAIDFDQLRQELSTLVVEGSQERYQLNWPGKREALLTANAPIAKTLRPCREESVDFDSTQNLFIEGDNLDALKLLQETYLGKVKIIYIDPPYNTGKEFIYDDDFSEDTASYFQRSNQKNEAGQRMVANTETNGRFHSDWLSMMYPRLKLARNLLRDDGVIFISIDDGEVANLRRICDEVFGESNFIAEIVWEGANKNTAQQIGVTHEYALVYAKSKTELETDWSIKKDDVGSVLREVARLVEKHGTDFETASEELAGWFRSMKGKPAFAHRRFRYIDDIGVYKEDDPTAPGGRKFDLVNPNTRVVIPLRRNRGWSFDQPTFNNLVSEGRISFVTESSIMVRRYLHETNKVTPQSVFYQPVRSASERMEKLLGHNVFPYPKDEQILKTFVEMATQIPDEAIVLDFFAGSATTAHAVMQLNAEDGGKRKFIMVQLPEVCDEKSEAFKAGYPTIAEIGKERIRRAGQKIKDEEKTRLKDEVGRMNNQSENSFLSLHPSSLDIGFRVLKIDSSNMKDIYYTPDAVQQGNLFDQIDNIREGRTAEDLLFQVLLDWGVDLTLPITQETIIVKDEGGKMKDEKGAENSSFIPQPSPFKEYQVFFVDDNALAACFDADINDAFVKELAARHPLRVVFRDVGFASDSVKINIEQIFKLISPTTEIKTL